MGQNTIDLQTALSDFTDGMKSLSMQRALQGANDQVNQIKSNETDQAKQRQQLSQVAQNLTMNMTSMGADPTSITAASGAIAPPTYKDANEMHMAGLLGNNPELMAQAKVQDAFENPEVPDKDQANKDRQFQLEKDKFNNTVGQQNTNDFKSFQKELNPDEASSRSVYGQWAQTDARGQRMDSIMKDPDHWKNMSIPDMTLVAEGLGNQAKGSALTADETAHLQNQSLAMYAAAAKAKATNGVATLDLSPIMGDYSNVMKAENATAQHGKIQNIVSVADGNAKSLYKRDPQQYKENVANSLSQHVGLNVSADDVSVDSSGKLNVKGVTDKLQTINQVPQHVMSAIKDMRNPSASSDDKAGAQKFFDMYGVTPNMKPQDAIKVIQRKMKQGMFQ